MAEETLDTNPDDTALVDGVADDQGDKGVASDTPAAKPEVKVDAKPDAKVDVKLDTKPDAKAKTDGDWPADWRDKVSGGDAKVMSRLSRYASPKALADALFNAQNKLASTRPALGKDATKEQISEYREALGIPESPDKYDLTGYTIGEKDKPLIEGFLAKAHATNQTPEQVKAGVDAYYDIVSKLTEDRAQQDATWARTGTDELRGEWGNDFRRNVNLINSFLDNAPAGFKEKLLGGRLADGVPLSSDPDTLRWLLSMELERNPVGVVAPGAGAQMSQTVDDEIKKIETAMRENRKAYDKDEKMQQRYRDLLTYRIEQAEKGRKAA